MTFDVSLDDWSWSLAALLVAVSLTHAMLYYGYSAERWGLQYKGYSNYFYFCPLLFKNSISGWCIDFQVSWEFEDRNNSHNCEVQFLTIQINSQCYMLVIQMVAQERHNIVSSSGAQDRRQCIQCRFESMIQTSQQLINIHEQPKMLLFERIC